MHITGVVGGGGAIKCCCRALWNDQNTISFYFHFILSSAHTPTLNAVWNVSLESMDANNFGHLFLLLQNTLSICGTNESYYEAFAFALLLFPENYHLNAHKWWIFWKHTTNRYDCQWTIQVWHWKLLPLKNRRKYRK